MNSPSQPDPYSPIDAEASDAPTKPKTAKGSRFWSLLVGLLLAAALALFALDRLGVRLPMTSSIQTPSPTPSGGETQLGSGGASSSASNTTVTAETAVPMTSAVGGAPAPAKPVVVFARQQDEIQMLIGAVQGLPSLAQPPKLTPPPAQDSAPPAPNPQATPEATVSPSTSQPGSVSSAQDLLAGPTIWSRLSDSLSELFVVRRLSPSAQPMLDTAGDRLARQELRLLLLSARMSLMLDQPRQARADLVAAQGLLPQFFRTEDTAVQAFAERLTAVLTSLPGQP